MLLRNVKILLDIIQEMQNRFFSIWHILGNPAVTRLILEAGAKIDHLNSVNRTAAQMAAFVGQHQCVRTINNFFPKERLEKFTKQQGNKFLLTR